MKCIRTFIQSKEDDVFRFKPNESFYLAIGVNFKRWGLIYRGVVDPTWSEFQRFAAYFDVEVSELLEIEKQDSV